MTRTYLCREDRLTAENRYLSFSETSSPCTINALITSALAIVAYGVSAFRWPLAVLRLPRRLARVAVGAAVRGLDLR